MQNIAMRPGCILLCPTLERVCAVTQTRSRGHGRVFSLPVLSPLPSRSCSVWRADIGASRRAIKAIEGNDMKTTHTPDTLTQASLAQPASFEGQPRLRLCQPTHRRGPDNQQDQISG